MKDTQSTETNRRPGRPSRYNPAWCDLLLPMGEKGFAISQMARELHITRSQLYRYRDAHPEFAEALDAARDLSLAYWTDELARASKDRNANAQLMMFLTSNLFPDDFRMKRDVAVSGGEIALPLRPLTRSLSTEELMRLAAPLLDAEIIEAAGGAQPMLPTPEGEGG